MRDAVTAYLRALQDAICAALEATDGSAFREDAWQHRTSGGGRTRILQAGQVFEKAGVNVSAIESDLTPALAARLKVGPQRAFAAGISLVLHPLSPMVPTVHANFRYFELANGERWFGGGADLTPWYLMPRDASHFHRTWKRVCDAHDPQCYPRFKKACDEYFFLPHRGETRGIGGIFFDYVRGDADRTWAFVQSCGNVFLESYLPIVAQRRDEPWGDAERQWQLIRRGRYVEFNLVYDRGTVFGLETGGRTESILMSLPPLVRWDYDAVPVPGSREAALVDVLRSPRSWVDA